MTLKTRLGNLGNIRDEDEPQLRLLQLESPVLSTAEFEAMVSHMGETAATFDCTFAPDGGQTALAEALDRIRQEAENAVRAGCEHVVLTDEAVGGARVTVPMILATGAVHTHLVRQKLRTFVSLNVRAGECLHVHYFAELIRLGATNAHDYLTNNSLHERNHSRPSGDPQLKQ